MNKKSFFLGIVTGIVITIVGFYGLSAINMNKTDNESVINQVDEDPIQYFEQAESYENKKEASFRVFQVLGNAALAKEASDKVGDDVMYLGTTVLILGENFYNHQIVKMKNPQIIGRYSYTSTIDRPMTVPVLKYK